MCICGWSAFDWRTILLHTTVGFCSTFLELFGVSHVSWKLSQRGTVMCCSMSNCCWLNACTVSTNLKEYFQAVIPVFSSAGRAFHVIWSKCCLDVNWDGTDHNCCTQRLVIWHAQTCWWTLITNQSKVNLTYFPGPNVPAPRKSGLK